MKAEIIAVGTELLLGDIVNTNAQFLSRELASLGVDVHFQTVVGDNPARLGQVIAAARARADLLVFSGGLGPTDDDVTKQTVAQAFGDALQFDAQECEKIERFFARWGRTMPQSNKKQAYVPVNGRKLPNDNGTAPGMIFHDAQEEGKYAVLLPGPPSELKPMFLQQVKPWLQSLSDSALYSVTLRVTGVGESHVERKLGTLLENTNPTAALYAKTAEVLVRITAKAPDEAQARSMCEAYAQQIEAVLGDAVYARGEESLSAAVVASLAQTGTTLAIAESCTGGLLAQSITAVPGASEVFEYGFITYANAAKHTLLGVSEQTLAEYGAVSSETAAEMAQGACNAAHATYGVAVTGIAGPGGGSAEKPVGLVYLAVADDTSVYVQRLLITDRPRDTVRAFSVQYALELVRRLAKHLPQPAATRFDAGQPAHLSAQTNTETKDI